MEQHAVIMNHRIGAMKVDTIYLAQQLGISRYAVSQWRINDIPIKHIPRICELMQLKKKDLRPDLWENE